MTDLPDQIPNRHGLQTVDRDILTPLVRQARNSQTCEIIDWDYEPVYGGAGDGGSGLSGIYRFAGKIRDHGETVPWSLILKVIGSPGHSGDPHGGTRERLAYQSGVLNDLSGPFIAARCFDVVERGEGVYWLWLEDLVDNIDTGCEADAGWTLARYAMVARHLGQFNGIYLTNGTVPDWPWLSQGWLRALLEPNASAIAQLGDVLDHPLVSRRYPADVAAGLLRLWAERELFLDALDRLPQTLCHLDAWDRNLFVRRDGSGQGQTVAIDWAFVGLGAIGEELAPLVQTRIFFHPAEAQVLDEMVFNRYLDGLREVGWDGDPNIVRFGYAASSALRYGLGFVESGLDRLLNFDESKALFVERVFEGRSIEEVADLWAELYRFLLKLADEARTLLESID